MDTNSRGQIITFYSYKGGTGRSMALANISCLLAERQAANGAKGVLMIDWDLEAPGLHRYFRNRIVSNRLGIERIEKPESLDARPGLIDLFVNLDQETDRQNARLLDEEQKAASTRDNTQPVVVRAEDLARATIAQVNLRQYILSTTVPNLDLIKAGSFNVNEPNEYSQRVNKFSWEALYKKSPQLVRMLAETLARDYAFVMIDSRTGITDISGVCTMMLPEKLVVVFTPNLQSLKGGIELIKEATTYRKESADLRPLTVFPLVSRVEANEPDLRHDWRFGMDDFEGYQRSFENLLSDIYEKPKIRLDRYFDEMQVQHIPRYAYGEEIAVLVEKIGDAFSLRRRYQTFAAKLAEGQVPWEGEIRESTDRADSAPITSVILDQVLDTMSLSGATRAARGLIVMLLLIGITVASFVAYQQFHKAQSAAVERQMLEDENKQLHTRVQKLEDPIQGILKENNDKIASLTQQVSSLTQERDAAVNEAQAQKQLADQTQAQLKSSTAASQKQLQSAKDALLQAQIDAQNADSARKDALQKYTVSQDTVRKLQSQYANCKCPRAGDR